ncbi:MAG: amidohydrolase family protein [Clostridia bacterium]|nr:amidohydrolase family protein [Clostridia bacterium]
MAFGLFKKKTFADSVFTGGVLHTLDPETEGSTAIACKDGKILRIGSDEDVRPLIGPDTAVTDLAGRHLTPGFIDLQGNPAARVLEGSYLRLHAGMSAEEVASEAEKWADRHQPCEFILGFGWFSDEEELPAITEACGDIPLLLIGEDSVGMRLNGAAQRMVKARAEAETFEVAITPAYVFDTVISMDYTAMAKKAFAIAEDYARRGYTSVLNLETCTYFDNLYRNLLLEFFQAGCLKQRYFGSLPVKRMINPLSVLYNLDRRRTNCSELQGLVNFTFLNVTASSDESDARCMSETYLKELCAAAADKGYSVRLNALDKPMALTGMGILGGLSTAYKKAAFTVAFDEEIADEEKADVYTGDVYEYPLSGPLPLAGSGEDMLTQLTENAAWRLGQRQLGSLMEGKSADFAVFSVDPASLSTPEEFDALRADLTVLAGSVAWDTSLGETAKDWFAAFDAQMQEEIEDEFDGYDASGGNDGAVV